MFPCFSSAKEHKRDNSHAQRPGRHYPRLLSTAFNPDVRQRMTFLHDTGLVGPGGWGGSDWTGGDAFPLHVETLSAAI